MRCNRAKRFLNRYIDKETVNKEVISQIEGHLDKCHHCKAELSSLTSMKDLIAQKEKINVEENFLIRLKDKLRKTSPIIKMRWLPEAGNLARRLIPVPLAAAVLICTLMFVKLNGINSFDDYIFSDLTNEEIGVLSEYIDSSDLLIDAVFKE